MVSSNDASLGDREDASKHGRKIDDIDKDAEITLIDETQGRYGDDLMFDTGVLDDEEACVGHDMDEKEINVVEKEVSTADPVTTAGEVVTTASPTETTTADDLTLAQTLIETRSAKSKVKGVVIGDLRNQQRKNIKLGMIRKLLKDFKIKIDDIDKDAEITLIDETQGMYGDDIMFDTGVLDDEEVCAGQDMDEKEINVAKKEVSTTDPITTAGEVVTTTSPTKNTIVDDLTLAQTLKEIRSAKSKVKEFVIGEQSESITRIRPQQLPSKDKGKAELEEEDRLVRQREEEANIVSWDNVQEMIDVDYQMAQQMQAEEQEKLSIEEKSKLFVQLLEARKKHFTAIRAKEKRNKPPTKAQKRNTRSTYLKNIVVYKHNQLKNKSFDDIQKLFDKSVKRVNTFVDMDTELVEGSEVIAEGSETRAEGSSKRAGEEMEQESSKKQKLEEDKESEELKQCLEIVPDDGDDVTIDATPLSTKSPTIVDYEIHKEGKKSFFQIIKAYGKHQMYLTFGMMLKNFDREDLEVLWSIVKARFKKTEPVNYISYFLI
ncbi:hypothetical protein Tco_0520232 [Tanacetum coccineum]